MQNEEELIASYEEECERVAGYTETVVKMLQMNPALHRFNKWIERTVVINNGEETTTHKLIENESPDFWVEFSRYRRPRKRECIYLVQAYWQRRRHHYDFTVQIHLIDVVRWRRANSKR